MTTDDGRRNRVGGRWLHYDHDGQPIEWLRWAELFEDMDYRRVGFTDLGHLGRVSTVWLGIDHNWGDGPPLIFETMVFGGAHDQATTRYPSRDMAITGHQNTVEDLRAGRPILWFQRQEVDTDG